MTARDPKDERIATLEKQVSELVDALAKLAGERPVHGHCHLPHYPPAPAIPYYPPVIVTPNTTWPGSWTITSTGTATGDGFVWYDHGVNAQA